MKRKNAKGIGEPENLQNRDGELKSECFDVCQVWIRKCHYLALDNLAFSSGKNIPTILEGILSEFLQGQGSRIESQCELCLIDSEMSEENKND
jgi:hypothetical protein